MKKMRKTKERVFSLLLTFVMVVSLFTGMSSVEVYAEEGTTEVTSEDTGNVEEEKSSVEEEMSSVEEEMSSVEEEKSSVEEETIDNVSDLMTEDINNVGVDNEAEDEIVVADGEGEGVYVVSELTDGQAIEVGKVIKNDFEEEYCLSVRDRNKKTDIGINPGGTVTIGDSYSNGVITATNGKWTVMKKTVQGKICTYLVKPEDAHWMEKMNEVTVAENEDGSYTLTITPDGNCSYVENTATGLSNEVIEQWINQFDTMYSTYTWNTYEMPKEEAEILEELTLDVPESSLVLLFKYDGDVLVGWFTFGTPTEGGTDTEGAIDIVKDLKDGDTIEVGDTIINTSDDVWVYISDRNAYVDVDFDEGPVTIESSYEDEGYLIEATEGKWTVLKREVEWLDGEVDYYIYIVKPEDAKWIESIKNEITVTKTGRKNDDGEDLYDIKLSGKDEYSYLFDWYSTVGKEDEEVEELVYRYNMMLYYNIQSTYAFSPWETAEDGMIQDVPASSFIVIYKMNDDDLCIGGFVLEPAKFENATPPANKPQTPPANNEDNLKTETEVAVDAPIVGATIHNLRDELLTVGNIFTQEERVQIVSGVVQARVWLEIGDTNEVADKAVIEQAVAKLGLNPNITYFDANLFKLVGNGVKTAIKEPGVKILVAVKLPVELLNTNPLVSRQYKIIRVHEGQVDVIEGIFSPETGEFVFATDKFSTYAIVYTDVPVNGVDNNQPQATETAKKDEVPKTGDSNVMLYAFALMLVSGISMVSYSRKRRMK